MLFKGFSAVPELETCKQILLEYKMYKFKQLQRPAKRSTLKKKSRLNSFWRFEMMERSSRGVQ